MNNVELSIKALAVYNERNNWTYLQGAIGNLAESDRSRGLYNYFWNQPNHSGNTMTMPYTEWLTQNNGKHCTDCSNFINYLLGYTYSHYSTSGLAKQRKFIGDKQYAPLGTILCMDGHVGIVVGKDLFIDFYRYNESCRLGKISESLFEYAVFLPEIEYNNRTPERLEVKVTIKKRYVGDTIDKSDFIVTVITKDAEEYEVKDYMFTPLQLTNTVNVVAIVYCDLIAYVTIDADSKGDLYVVQIPCMDKETALRYQKDLVLEGYEGTSVIQI